jgi:hypothetical protein
MTDVPLYALLRRASRLAEGLFNKDGEFDPFFVCDIPGKELAVVITPLIGKPGLAAIEYKDRLTAKLRVEFAEKGVTRYVAVAECWMAEPPKQDMTPLEVSQYYAALDFSLKNDPKRKEVVVLTADDGKQQLSAMREIIRPANGRPYLGKLEPFEQTISQRLGDLLPARRDTGARDD